MPDSTYFGATLTNLGPLVTPFTSAPSCTESTNLAIATKAPDGLHIFGVPDCNVTLSAAGCFPDGSKVDELFDSPKTDLINTLVYHSPGIECPSGWTTAGSIVGPSGWDSASGVFTRPHFPYYNDGRDIFPQNIGPVDQYVGALEPSETLAWCCPSGMDVNIGGGCYSSVQPLASYSSYSGVCQVLFDGDLLKTVTTFDGSVYSNGIYSPATPTEPVTRTTTYETDYINPTDSDTFIVTQEAAVVLVHREEDMTKGDGATTTAGKPAESGKGSDDDTDEGDDDDVVGDSAGARLNPVHNGLWGSVTPFALAAGTVFVTMIML